MARELIDRNAALQCLCYAATRLDSDSNKATAMMQMVRSAHVAAVNQLYYGPSARCLDELSWEQAVQRLRTWWHCYGCDLWVHEDDPAEVSYGEPSSDHTCDDDCRSDGCWFNEESGYRCVDSSDVGKAIFGKELFPYIR